MNNEQPNNLNNFPQENSPSVEPAGMPVNNLGSVEEVPNPTPQESAPSFGAPIMEPPIVPNPTSQTTEPKKKKGINKGLLIAIIAILVVMIAVGGYAAYLFFGVSPKKVHNNIIDEVFANATGFAEKLMASNYNADAKTIKTSSTISFDTNLDELSMLKNYAFKIDAGIDRENNFVNSNFAILEKNNEILNGNVYLLNNKAYFDSPKLYDRVIEIGDFEFDINETLEAYEVLDSDRLTHLLDTLKNGFKDGFDENKFTRKLENVNLNGKEIKAFNNSYIIEESDAYSIIKSMLTAIKNDDESIETVVDFINDISSSLSTIESEETPYQITKDDVLKTLDSAIAQITDAKMSGSSNKIFFNVYTNIITNNVIAVKLISVADNQSQNLLEYSVDGDTSKIHIGDADGSTFSFDITTKDNKSDYKFTIDGVTLITGTVEYSDNKASLSLSIDTSSIIPDISSVSLEINSEEKDNSNSTELKLSVNAGDKIYEVSIKEDSTIAYDEAIAKPNVSNSVPLDQVDEDALNNNMSDIIKNSDLGDLLGDYLDEIYFSPSEPDTSYSEHCDEASNCKCSGLSCTCRYLNDDFEYEDIVCPSPNI